MREKRIDFMALWDYYRQQWVIAVSSLISVHWTCETHQGKSIRKNDRSKIISDLRAFRIVSYVRFNDRIHVLWLGPMKYRALAHLWFNHFPFNSDSLECFRYNFPPHLIYLLLVIGQKWCVAVERNVREGERCREKGDVRDFKLPRHDYFVMFFFSLFSLTSLNFMRRRLQHVNGSIWFCSVFFTAHFVLVVAVVVHLNFLFHCFPHFDLL